MAQPSNLARSPVLAVTSVKWPLPSPLNSLQPLFCGMKRSAMPSLSKSAKNGADFAGLVSRCRNPSTSTIGELVAVLAVEEEHAAARTVEEIGPAVAVDVAHGQGIALEPLPAMPSGPKPTSVETSTKRGAPGRLAAAFLPAWK